MIAAVIVASMAENFVSWAYSIWNTFIKYCYDTLTVSPFDFGAKLFSKTGELDSSTSILSTIINNIEPIMIGVGTGLLILFWVIGILRESGNMLAERSQPYAFVTHLLRLFICEGLIAADYYIVYVIFDIFTLATSAIVGSAGKINYGFIDPSDADAISDNFLSTIGIDDKTVSVITAIQESQKQSVKDALLIEIFTMIYLIVVVACAVVIFMKVYGRYFRIIASIVIAPVGIAMFASSNTEQSGRKYIFYLLKQGAEGAIIAIDLVMFNIVATRGDLQPTLFKSLVNWLTEEGSTANIIIGYYITQIFMCVLLMTLISATEKMTEQLF